MKRYISLLSVSGLLCAGLLTVYAKTDVNVGGWDDDDKNVTVKFVSTPSAVYAGLRLTLSSPDEGARIFWTTDPVTDPAASDAWEEYTAPLNLTEDCTVRFYAESAEGARSETGSYTFVYTDHQAPAPLLSADEAARTLTMTSTVPGATIRYTEDASEPDENSKAYTSPVEITSYLYRARVFAADMFPSDIAEYAASGETLISPVPTADFSDRKLHLTCTSEKASILYTFDAAASPADDAAWLTYSAPLSLTEDCTVRFFSRTEGCNDSDVQSFTFVLSAYRAADPMIERDAAGTHIVMATSTEGGEIRYTTDDSEPTEESALYTGPVAIEGNFTYSAKTFAKGMFESKTNRYVVANMAVPDPYFLFGNKRFRLECLDPQAEIWYTTDASASTDDMSAWTLYSAPISLTSDCTLRFFSRRQNYNDSDIESLTYVHTDYQMPAPSVKRNNQGTHILMDAVAITPPSGYFPEGEDTEGVLAGPEIHYTTDGSYPTGESPIYMAPIRISAGAVYRARVIDQNYYDSEVTEYAIGDASLPVPVAEFRDFALTLTCSDPDASIWYTSDPEATLDNLDLWTLYTAPVKLTGDATFRFFAGDDDENASDVQTFVFQKTDYTVAAPTVERTDDGTHVEMATTTPGADIRYTTDGTVPTEESALYIAPVEITCNMTFIAKAFLEGYYDSEVTEFGVNNMAVPVATAVVADKMLVLNCADALAEIWYTTDATATPDDLKAWTLYTAPVALDENATYHFFTRRERFNDSDVQTFVFRKTDYQVETPFIARNEEGSFLVMTCGTPGAEIRYTVDGTDPTSESTLYTEPVMIDSNGTYRARAFAEGLFDSGVVEYTVTNMVVMNPYSTFENLKMTLACPDEKASILYTLDPEAAPEDSEAWTLYTEPITLTGDCTLRFFARRQNFNDSDIESLTFVYAAYQAAAPAITPDMDRTHLMMTCSTEGARIRYTTDGSEPTAESTLYEGPVAIEANGTIRARAFADDMFDSPVSEYIVDFLTVALPSAAFENKALVISAAGEREEIYFTTDPDAEPGSDAWNLYTGPIALTEDCTVRYYATRDGYNPSAIGSFSFIYAAYQVAAPMLSADEEGTHVVMSCDTPDADIRYTTDGSEPTQESTLYTEPVEITGNGTFRARAFADGLFDSDIVDYIVMHLAVPTPTAAFENKRLILTCADEKATIYYTADQNAAFGDADAWKPYTEPIALTEDCTVRFYARRDNFNDSDIQSFAFVYSAYRTADPTIERNAEGTHIVMESATEGAGIRFTTDGTEPTAASDLYTGPIAIEGNFTFSAIAIADGLFDSAVNRYVVSNMAAPDPTATFENLKMTLACPDGKASILYTLDLEAVLEDAEAWTLYTEPITLTGDCTLRFFARRDNFNDSDIESLTFVYAAYQAPAPSIARNAQGTHIVMTAQTEGTRIRYTADGSEPTAESPLYEAPVRIQEGATYRARVFVDNMFDSEITEYAIGNDRLNVPTAAYDHFTLVLSTDQEGVQIWYTTDPELSVDNVDAWTLYEAPLPLGEDCTYRFFAGDDDANASDVQSFVFQKVDWQVAVPTIERDEAGTHIVMETPTEGAEIRYTMDGSEPSKESALYTAPVEITGNFTYRARAFADGLYDSETTDFTVANMASPVGSATFENKLLTLTCPDPEAEIWYTNDDDATPEDDEAWELYTGPLALTEDCFIHFFTRKENFNHSDIETFVFLRAGYMVAAPSIERSEDGSSIVMATETEGAEIRYTTDGSEPTEESELYTEPVFLTQNCTFRARAFAEGLFESAISDFTVANLMMMMPHAEFHGLRLTLSVWDEAASIWYTTNPDALPEDEEAWTLYTEPIALDADCTVRYFARRGGFLDSQIAAYEFVYSDWQTAAPELEYNPEYQEVSVSCSTEGAEIRYTLDGSEPTEESLLYEGPIAVSGDVTVKARAFTEGLFASAVASITVSGTSAVEGLYSADASIRIERDAFGVVVIASHAASIPVYTMDGVLVKVLDLEKGRNAVSDLSAGIYIIAGKKVRL